jgi:competence protein ComGC
MKEKNLMMLLIFIINISLLTVIPITAQIDEPQELTKDDNVTSTIKPQGASIEVQNETSMSEDNSQTTSAGNVTSTIKPQGTSIDNTN